MLQTVVSSLVELTILEIFGLQKDLGSFIMETITLSNQGAIVLDLGMPVSFWTSVCVLKTMYVVVVLYGYLSSCSEKYICWWRCVSHGMSILYVGVILYCEQ